MVLSASRGFGLSRCCPFLLGVLVCHGVVRYLGFCSVTVLSASRGFGLSRCCPLLEIWFVTVLSACRGFGLSRCCPFLGALVCHGVARFWGFWSVTVLSTSRYFGLSQRCPLLGNVCHDDVPF